MKLGYWPQLPLLLATAISGCAINPIDERIADVRPKPLPPSLQITDLRADKWKTTHFVPNARGAVQHFGDDAVPDGLPNYIAFGLLEQLDGAALTSITFKTIDLRVSIPDLEVPAMGQHTLNGDQAHYRLTAKSSVSSVVCIAVDGNSYLGDFGTLARFGLKEELRQAIDKSIAKLAGNLRSKQKSASPACEPGWEGGQQR